MTKWISRASVLRIIDADPVYSDVINEKTYMASQINDLPTKEETSRLRGEWIFTGRHNVYGGAEIECSNCHNKLMVSPSRWEIGENFCDVCGSRNKKEGESE